MCMKDFRVDDVKYVVIGMLYVVGMGVCFVV